MEDNIEVTPSEENGNVPLETPSEQPQDATPAEKEATEPVVPKEPELFELPDGRKVDAETVAQEYKNLLSDYTRKSQALAEKEKENITNNKPSDNPYANPDYIPQSYEEILQVAEERALKAIEAREQQRIESQQAIENEVATQLESIKKTDPTLDENALFLHANKYGFRDLNIAYQNMKDMSELAKKVKTATANDIAKRNDPVSIKPGAIGQTPDPTAFQTARDYLRSLNK